MTSVIQLPSDIQDDLRDVQGVLVLLSMALALIAAPTTPVIVARVTAVMAQHTAMAWAELLDGVIAEQGGDL
ncbi:hypothetical protein JRG49_17855 [Pseudomonas fulva]|jgi:hypothetical protein|uniref:hypothetical protein n=1 Tax=Pseudomonas TaxID=286 RepID=UPI000733E920|nr:MULTISPECIES: hypothetical protein [Pseudomonas]MCY3929444.1 hypothetical protein [Acidobacteriota bacterium]KTT02147.1 hypothetical protein NS212_03125 [Pseudomonas parafulva]MBA1221868.1 hypothetical protein [Pseudomonas fulva]MBN4166794.1 hypothetical protein [Pseudomonas fulva]MBN6791903.1 hypothetical protein [Pseudomonas fulva]